MADGHDTDIQGLIDLDDVQRQLDASGYSLNTFDELNVDPATSDDLYQSGIPDALTDQFEGALNAALAEKTDVITVRAKRLPKVNGQWITIWVSGESMMDLGAVLALVPGWAPIGGSLVAGGAAAKYATKDGKVPVGAMIVSNDPQIANKQMQLMLTPGYMIP